MFKLKRSCVTLPCALPSFLYVSKIFIVFLSTSERNVSLDPWGFLFWWIYCYSSLMPCRLTQVDSKGRENKLSILCFSCIFFFGPILSVLIDCCLMLLQHLCNFQFIKICVWIVVIEVGWDSYPEVFCPFIIIRPSFPCATWIFGRSKLTRFPAPATETCKPSTFVWAALFLCFFLWLL